MNRLQSELQRLYLPGTDAGSDGTSPSLIDAGGRVRALVLEVARPASWEVLGKVWHGVQAEFELPAPGIAVSGTDGLQLWFSLDEPIVAGEGHAFLEALRMRFLADVAPRRIGLHPASTSPGSHAGRVPARQESTGNWSAFVAADLAPVFVDTPWLDIPPSEEGQAGLLRGLERIKPSAFDAAWQRLGRPARGGTSPNAGASTRADAAALAAAGPATATSLGDPRRFLLRVMNDDTVSLRLRVEAAKALLPYSQDSRDLQPGTAA